MLFEKSKIQNFRELSSFITVEEYPKIGNFSLAIQDKVQNHEFYASNEENYTKHEGICKFLNLFQTTSLLCDQNL